MDLLTSSLQRGFRAVGAGAWMPIIREPGAQPSRSFSVETEGGTVGQTVTVELHAWPNGNTPPVAGDANTLVGTITVTIGTTYSNGISGKGVVPDLTVLPYSMVAAYCTSIGTGGIAAFPMFDGV